MARTQEERDAAYENLVVALKEYRAGIVEDLKTQYNGSPTWSDEEDGQFLVELLMEIDEFAKKLGPEDVVRRIQNW